MDDRFPPPHRSSCPHCGAAVDGRAAECAGCGLVFAKWRPKAAPAAGAVPAAEASLEGWRARRLHSGLKGAAWFGAALFVAWTALKPPGGRPVPADALRDPALGFSVSLPAGWTVRRRDVARPETVLALEAGPQGADAWFSAVVVEGSGLPEDLAPGERGGVPRLLGAAFPEAGSDLTYLYPTRARADNLKALRLEGTGSRRTSRTVEAAVDVDPLVQRLREHRGLPPQPVTYVTKVVEEQHRVRFAVLAVPGAGRRYAVGVIGDEAAFLARQAEAEAWLESFRVTRRPLSLEHLAGLAVRTAKGEFIQQTVISAVLLLWALSRWLFSPLAE